MTHDVRLVAAALACWAAAGVCVEQPSVVAMGCAVVGVVVAAIVRRAEAALVLACLATVSAAVAWHVAAVESSRAAAAAAGGAMVVAEVQVRDDARTIAGGGVVVGVQIRRVEVGGRVVETVGRATAFVARPEGADRLVTGRRAVVQARLRPAVRSDEVAVLAVQRIEAGGAPWWWDASSSVRAAVREAAGHGVGEGRDLVPALVVGDDAGLSAEIQADFQRSGLTHLLAVSGTNLTIVLAAVLGAARAAGVGRRWRVPLGLLAVVGFVLVARPEPSVLRAAAMGVVGLAAIGVGRRAGVRALAVAVLVLLVVDPWLARAAGFVLSVSATAGIVVLASPLAERLRWMPRWLALAVAVPTAAQFAVTPALVALSGEVSVVAVVANLVAAPAVSPATVLGLAAGLVGLLVDPLGVVLGWPATVFAQWIVVVGHAAGGLAGASVPWRGPWIWVMALMPVAGWLAWRWARSPVVVMGVTAGLAAAIVHPPTPGWPPAGWIMVACDVGQGDASVLALDRPGEAIVIDTGPDDVHVNACLRRLHVDRVRLFVLTHGDADHAAGAAGVARGRRIDLGLVGPGGGQMPTGVPVRHAAAGDRFAVGSLAGEVLWPPAGVRLETTNEAGIVLRVVSRGVSVLLTADVPAAIQDRLLRAGADVGVDVLKFPHHGSADTSADFIAATGATIATISCGIDNTYGHPNPKALAMLSAAGIGWARTDQRGDVAIVVDDRGRLNVVSRLAGRRCVVRGRRT